MATQQNILTVYELGELTVVGFGGHEILDQMHVADFRDEVTALIEEHNCKVLAIDLTGVTLIPSGLLGMLASLRKSGVEVHLYNASDDVREVLAVTRLDQWLPVHQVDMP